MAATSSVDREAEILLQRYAELEGDQRIWLNLWQEIADFIQPRKGNIAFRRTSAQQQTDRIMDSTAIHANELLAASMQGALTSGAFRWFSLALSNVDLKENHPVAVDLEACSDDMFRAINDSNFQSETHEVYLDAPCFGTACITVEERMPSKTVPGGSLRFTAGPPGSFCIDEDAEGFVDTVFTRTPMSARAIAAAYGEKNCGSQIQGALKNNSIQKFDVIHAVYPRTDIALLGDQSRRLPTISMPYASITLDYVGRKILKRSGYQEDAVLVPRWSKTTGETFGRGPGVTALPDIKTLNKAVELKLKAWAKMVDPPMMVRDEAVVGQVQFRSAGITYVRDMDSIKSLGELSGDVKGADMQEDGLRKSIQRMFYSDQLQLQEGPQMTAYEVQVRYELMQRILGPTLGRLTVELLNPLINRIFWIRLRASKQNSPYRRVLAWCQKNNIAMNVEYEGPLAKAQRLAESTAMQRYFQIILPLTQVDPSVVDNIDLDFVARDHADSVGTPAKMLRSVEDVTKIRAIRAKQQAQQAQQQAIESTAKAGGAVAPLLKAAKGGAGGAGGAAGGPVAPLVAALSGQKEGSIPQGQPVVQSG